MPDIANATQHHRLRRPGFIDALQSYGGLYSGLTHYWQLEEASGPRGDSISNLTPLLPSGSPGNATGKKGNGLSVAAASTQYLNSPTTTIVTLNADRSIALWIKPTATAVGATQRPIASQGSAPSDGSSAWILMLSPQGVAAGKLGVYHLAVGYSAAGATTLSAGTFYHLAYVRSGTGWTLYLNGSSELTGTVTTETGNNAIFYTGVGFNNYFDGVIDEVGTWSRALSSGEVSALYNSGNGAAYPYFT